MNRYNNKEKQYYFDYDLFSNSLTKMLQRSGLVPAASILNEAKRIDNTRIYFSDNFSPVQGNSFAIWKDYCREVLV